MNEGAMHIGPMSEARVIEPGSAKGWTIERTSEECGFTTPHAESDEGRCNIRVVGHRRGHDGRGDDRERDCDAHDDSCVGSRGIQARRRAERESGNQSSGVTHCQLLKIGVVSPI
jgi:hypothetical protein